MKQGSKMYKDRKLLIDFLWQILYTLFGSRGLHMWSALRKETRPRKLCLRGLHKWSAHESGSSAVINLITRWKNAITLS